MTGSFFATRGINYEWKLSNVELRGPHTTKNLPLVFH